MVNSKEVITSIVSRSIELISLISVMKKLTNTHTYIIMTSISSMYVCMIAHTTGFVKTTTMYDH